MLLGFFLYNKIPQQELEGFSQLELVLAILIVILVGAVFWYIILRLNKKVEIAYSFGIGLLFSGVVDAMVHDVLSQNVATLARLFVFGGTFFLYYKFVKLMQNSTWKSIQWKLQLNNFITMVAMAFVAIQLGKSLKPGIAVLLFFVVAIYDALAVWKLGTMQDMTRKFLASFVIPGISYAKKKKNQFAILGGGDIFFLLLVPAALANASGTLAIGSAIGMFTAICVLFYMSTKKVFYPALPFMFIGLLGALVAYGLRVWVM